MGSTKAHALGAPNWFELATTDQLAAKAFYSRVFGWSAVDHAIDGGGNYTIFENDGRECAACYTMMPEQVEQGIPPHWDIYFRVADADASAVRAVELGGQVVVEPFDVMDHLRMAVLADPTGAVFAIAQPHQHPGVGVIRDAHAITWVELATRDLGRAEAFYRDLFDWTLTDHPGAPVSYRLIGTPDGNVGGLMQMTAEWGDIPPHWSIYIQVADVDAMLERAVAAGGRINVPAFDAPGVGRIAQIADPAGAWVYLITLNARA
ncbi:MAG TPA: hypothetical protein DDZ76_15905 [Xanthomonadales bacterium]|nr:hypothetical protein [Xanthomonadales bacterium]